MLNYGGFKDIVLALILSPILAFVIGYVVMHAEVHLCQAQSAYGE